MDFFRPNIEKSITLPSPPLRDEDEISRMKDIIRNRTAEELNNLLRLLCILKICLIVRDHLKLIKQ